MRLYVESGQRALAIKQYQACCKVLDQELGIPPMEETQALHQKILTGTGLEQLRSSVQQVGDVEVKKNRALIKPFRNFAVPCEGLKAAGKTSSGPYESLKAS